MRRTFSGDVGSNPARDIPKVHGAAREPFPTMVWLMMCGAATIQRPKVCPVLDAGHSVPTHRKRLREVEHVETESAKGMDFPHISDVAQWKAPTR